MGILAQTSNYQKFIKKTNKIPDYAREYRNDYLFIRGINKVCEDFVEILGREEIFKSHQADRLMRYFNKFSKAQQLDYLNDTSETNFKYEDVKSIESLDLQLNDYMNLYYDPDRCKFDEEKYNNVENDFPGFKRFFECFSRFNDKINVDEVSEEDYYKSLIYDSDDDDDDDYVISGLVSDSDDSDDSDSDSD